MAYGLMLRVGWGERAARRLAAAASGCALVVVVVVWFAASGPGAGSGVSHSVARRGLAGLPVAARVPVSEALGADLPGYRVAGLRAVNPAQRFSLGFSASGVSVVSAHVRVRLGLVGVGRSGALRSIQPVEPHVAGNRVVYARRGLSEWYANGPLGLEQGFLVRSRPAGAGPVVLSVALPGSGGMRMDHGQVLLGGGLRYGGLVVVDAAGRRLRSWIVLSRSRVLMEIADWEAVYPLRVDPFVQQGGNLAASDEVGAGRFGISVSLSADGNTALIGGNTDNNQGAAWVFVRSGSTWTQQGPKLTPSDEAARGEFGSSVALSSDGNTALIGGQCGFYSQDGTRGGAWVFVRSGSTWTQQGPRFVGSNQDTAGIPGQYCDFGSSAALSADGNTALIGGATDGTYHGRTSGGAAWVFVRSGSIWTQQGPKLNPSDATGGLGGPEFGSSVALSSDGNTALIGGPYDGNAGAAWVFVRSGSAWAQQGSKLTPNDAVRSDRGWDNFGSSVTVSAGGNTALIGGLYDDNGGAAWVFTRSGASWAQDGSKLTTSGEVSGGSFGASAALSADGNTALIGAPVNGPNFAGTASVFINRPMATVTRAGDGSGTVTSSPAGITCGHICSALYTPGTTVRLTATPAPGSVLAGWSGSGCSGTGTCTLTLSSDQTVTATFVAPLPRPKITKARIDRNHHQATFSFRARGARRFQCALIKQTNRGQRKPRFTTCRPPKAYRRLKRGRYIFEVRGLSHGPPGPATKRRFSI